MRRERTQWRLCRRGLANTRREDLVASVYVDAGVVDALELHPELSRRRREGNKLALEAAQQGVHEAVVEVHGGGRSGGVSGITPNP